MTTMDDARVSVRDRDPLAQPGPDWALLVAAWAVVLGVGVGVATSLLQAHLNPPWFSLVNSASPWLLPGFVLGAVCRSWAGAALAGCATVVFEVAGFYAAVAERGHGISHREVLFWGACAVVGGPVVGLAGHSWWRPVSSWWRGLGAATMVGSFVSEATAVYWEELHYDSSALLFVAVGFGLLVVLGMRGRQHLEVVGWLLMTVPAGLAAQLILNHVTQHAFG